MSAQQCTLRVAGGITEARKEKELGSEVEGQGRAGIRSPLPLTHEHVCQQVGLAPGAQRADLIQLSIVPELDLQQLKQQESVGARLGAQTAGSGGGGC